MNIHIFTKIWIFIKISHGEPFYFFSLIIIKGKKNKYFNFKIFVKIWIFIYKPIPHLTPWAPNLRQTCIFMRGMLWEKNCMYLWKIGYITKKKSPLSPEIKRLFWYQKCGILKILGIFVIDFHMPKLSDLGDCMYLFI